MVSKNLFTISKVLLHTMGREIIVLVYTTIDEVYYKRGCNKRSLCIRAFITKPSHSVTHSGTSDLLLVDCD